MIFDNFCKKFVLLITLGSVISGQSHYLMAAGSGNSKYKNSKCKTGSLNKFFTKKFGKKNKNNSSLFSFRSSILKTGLKGLCSAAFIYFAYKFLSSYFANNNQNNNQNNLLIQNQNGNNNTDYQNRVNQVLNFANEKRWYFFGKTGLIGNAKFNVKLDDNKEIENRVYQLRVKQQKCNSCGAMAIKNVINLGGFFENGNDGRWQNGIEILQNLHSTPEGFFQECERILGQDRIGYSYSGLFWFGTRQPVNLTGESIEKIITNYDCNRVTGPTPINKENNIEKNLLGIKKVDVLDGYVESFDNTAQEELINKGSDYEEIIKFTKGKNIDLIGSLKNVPVGYTHGYIFTTGELERLNINSSNDDKNDGKKESCHGKDMANSIGHWKAIFVVKTAENQFCWFVLDSMNWDNVISNAQNGEVANSIKAYIYKFLGQSYEPYENFIENNCEGVKKAEAMNLFKKIDEKIEVFKDCEKDEKLNNIKFNDIKMGEELKKEIVGQNKFKDLENEEVFKEIEKIDILKKWFDVQVTDVTKIDDKFVKPEDKELLIKKIKDYKSKFEQNK